MSTLDENEGRGLPVVSVVMPVYQVSDYIDDAISSVLSQTFSDLELIIVDDGSTDGSGEKCDAWANSDSRIIVFHQNNAGQSSARNLALSKAKGDYLLFVDSDDFLQPCLLEFALQRLQDTDSDICFFKYLILKQNGKLEPYKESAIFPQDLLAAPKETLKYLMEQRIHHYPWARLAKRRLYVEGNEFFPVGRKMEDIATTARLITRASAVSFLDKELYVYRMREGSTVFEWSHRLTFDTIKAIADIQVDIELFDVDVRASFLNYKIKMMFYCMMMECRLPDHKIVKEPYALAKKEMQQAAACARNKLTSANKVRLILARLGLTNFVAIIRDGR